MSGCGHSRNKGYKVLLGQRSRSCWELAISSLSCFHCVVFSVWQREKRRYKHLVIIVFLVYKYTIAKGVACLGRVAIA